MRCLPEVWQSRLQRILLRCERKVKRSFEILHCTWLRLLFHFHTRFQHWSPAPLPPAWQPQTVLLIHWGGIGNYVLFSGVPFELRKRYPSARIVTVVREESVAKFLRGSDLTDEVFVGYPEDLEGENRLQEFQQQLRPYSFDLAITAAANDARASSQLSFLSGAAIRIGENPWNRGYLYTHTIINRSGWNERQTNFELLKVLGIPAENENLYVSWTKEDEQEKEVVLKELISNHHGKLIGMHPGCQENSKWKRWPIQKFVTLVQRLTSDEDVRILAFGGPGEEELTQPLVEAGKQQVIDLAGKLSIRATAAAIMECDIFVSNDSGLYQIAHALKKPGVVIFGPSDFKRNGPEHENYLPVYEKLPCIFCYSRGPYQCPINRKCLYDLSVTRVEEVVRKLMKDISNTNRANL